MGNSIISLVPARKNSKGFKNKNVKLLNGLPLFQHSVNLSLKMGIECVISTDIESILESEQHSKVKIIDRPKKLCEDNSKIEKVILHFIEHLGLSNYTIVLLQATSPLRRISDVQKSLDLFSNNMYDLVLTVRKIKNKFLKSGFIDGTKFSPVSKVSYCFENRQFLPDIYLPNGAVYIFNSDWFRKNKGFQSNHIGAVLMDDTNSIDIDSENDFNEIKKRFNKLGHK